MVHLIKGGGAMTANAEKKQGNNRFQKEKSRALKIKQL